MDNEALLAHEARIKECLKSCECSIKEMLCKSESRISETHSLIDKLTHICEFELAEYSKYLDKISSNRDDIIKQNSKLIEANMLLTKQIDELQKQNENTLKYYRSLVEKMLLNNATITINK